MLTRDLAILSKIEKIIENLNDLDISWNPYRWFKSSDMVHGFIPLLLDKTKLCALERSVTNNGEEFEISISNVDTDYILKNYNFIRRIPCKRVNYFNYSSGFYTKFEVTRRSAVSAIGHSIELISVIQKKSDLKDCSDGIGVLVIDPSKVSDFSMFRRGMFHMLGESTDHLVSDYENFSGRNKELFNNLIYFMKKSIVDFILLYTKSQVVFDFLSGDGVTNLAKLLSNVDESTSDNALVRLEEMFSMVLLEDMGIWYMQSFFMRINWINRSEDVDKIESFILRNIVEDPQN